MIRLIISASGKRIRITKIRVLFALWKGKLYMLRNLDCSVIIKNIKQKEKNYEKRELRLLYERGIA